MFVLHGGMCIGLSGSAYIALMCLAIAAIASSSDVMLLPFSLKIGAACGMSMRSSCAIFAQFVCLENASCITAFFFRVRADQLPYLRSEPESLSTVGCPW